MEKKYKKIIIFLIFALVLIEASPVYALEIKYFNLPMVGNPEYCADSGGCLGLYVSWWFTFGIYIAGALALISFTIGAIGLINPNPEAHNEAKDRMKSSVLGLVLTLSAFVLLRTINPQFISPTLTPLPGVDGIFYMKDINHLIPAPMSEENVANITEGYKNIYYKCNYDENGGYMDAPDLLIWKFPKPGLESGNNLFDSQINIKRLSCGESTSVGSGSFKMAYETVGVYYYVGEGCSGYMSNANTTVQDKLSDPFKGKLKSVRIVNNSNTHYGVIFHNKPDAYSGSDCTIPILGVTNSSDICEDISLNLAEESEFSVFSARIFKHTNLDFSSSGDGVWFYSDVNGWDSGNKSGVYYVSNDQLASYSGGDYYFSSETEKLTFDYTWVDGDMALTCNYFPACRDVDWENYDYIECCTCASPKDWSLSGENCGGSIQIGGSYLVTLYSKYTDKEDGKEKWFCQSFDKDTPNLSTSGSAQPAGSEISTISIIPTK